MRIRGCPLKYIPETNSVKRCSRDECEWWLDEEEMCPVLLIGKVIVDAISSRRRERDTTGEATGWETVRSV
jgi:hypothetical protein